MIVAAPGYAKLELFARIGVASLGKGSGDSVPCVHARTPDRSPAEAAVARRSGPSRFSRGCRPRRPTVLYLARSWWRERAPAHGRWAHHFLHTSATGGEGAGARCQPGTAWACARRARDLLRCGRGAVPGELAKR